MFRQSHHLASFFPSFFPFFFPSFFPFFFPSFFPFFFPSFFPFFFPSFFLQKSNCRTCLPVPSKQILPFSFKKHLRVLKFWKLWWSRGAQRPVPRVDEPKRQRRAAHAQARSATNILLIKPNKKWTIFLEQYFQKTTSVFHDLGVKQKTKGVLFFNYHLHTWSIMFIYWCQEDWFNYHQYK